MKNRHTGYPEDEFITCSDAAQFLNISLPTLRKYSQSGMIPFYRVGSRILYLKREVINAVTNPQAEKLKSRRMDD